MVELGLAKVPPPIGIEFVMIFRLILLVFVDCLKFWSLRFVIYLLFDAWDLEFCHYLPSLHLLNPYTIKTIITV